MAVRAMLVRFFPTPSSRDEPTPSQRTSREMRIPAAPRIGLGCIYSMEPASQMEQQGLRSPGGDSSRTDQPTQSKDQASAPTPAGPEAPIQVTGPPAEALGATPALATQQSQRMPESQSASLSGRPMMQRMTMSVSRPFPSQAPPHCSD